MFDRQKKNFISYRHQENGPYSLLSNRIARQGIIEGQSGLLWILTDAGINRLNLLGKCFNSFQHEEHNPDSLSGNRVLGIYEDPQGQLWVGTNDNGLNFYEENNNRFIMCAS